MIRTTETALGALVDDHLAAAVRVLTGEGAQAVRIAAAVAYIEAARRGLRTINATHKEVAA